MSLSFGRCGNINFATAVIEGKSNEDRNCATFNHAETYLDKLSPNSGDTKRKKNSATQAKKEKLLGFSGDVCSFGVFDGHNGSYGSEHCANNLHHNIMTNYFQELEQLDSKPKLFPEEEESPHPPPPSSSSDILSSSPSSRHKNRSMSGDDFGYFDVEEERESLHISQDDIEQQQEIKSDRIPACLQRTIQQEAIFCHVLHTQITKSNLEIQKLSDSGTTMTSVFCFQHNKDGNEVKEGTEKEKESNIEGYTRVLVANIGDSRCVAVSGLPSATNMIPIHTNNHYLSTSNLSNLSNLASSSSSPPSSFPSPSFIDLHNNNTTNTNNSNSNNNNNSSNNNMKAIDKPWDERFLSQSAHTKTMTTSTNTTIPPPITIPPSTNANTNNTIAAAAAMSSLDDDSVHGRGYSSSSTSQRLSFTSSSSPSSYFFGRKRVVTGTESTNGKVTMTSSTSTSALTMLLSSSQSNNTNNTTTNINTAINTTNTNNSSSNRKVIPQPTTITTTNTTNNTNNHLISSSMNDIPTLLLPHHTTTNTTSTKITITTPHTPTMTTIPSHTLPLPPYTRLITFCIPLTEDHNMKNIRERYRIAQGKSIRLLPQALPYELSLQSHEAKVFDQLSGNKHSLNGYKSLLFQHNDGNVSDLRGNIGELEGNKVQEWMVCVPKSFQLTNTTTNNNSSSPSSPSNSSNMKEMLYILDTTGSLIASVYDPVYATNYHNTNNNANNNTNTTNNTNNINNNNNNNDNILNATIHPMSYTTTNINTNNINNNNTNTNSNTTNNVEFYQHLVLSYYVYQYIHTYYYPPTLTTPPNNTNNTTNTSSPLTTSPTTSSTSLSCPSYLTSAYAEHNALQLPYQLTREESYIGPRTPTSVTNPTTASTTLTTTSSGGKPGPKQGPIAYFSRFNRSLLMTRSIGDRFGPRNCLSLPEITAFTIPTTVFVRLVICSDGVWDVMDNDTIRRMSMYFHYPTPEQLAGAIARKAKARRERLSMRSDDITVSVIDVNREYGSLLKVKYSVLGLDTPALPLLPLIKKQTNSILPSSTSLTSLTIPSPPVSTSNSPQIVKNKRSIVNLFAYGTSKSNKDELDCTVHDNSSGSRGVRSKSDVGIVNGIDGNGNGNGNGNGSNKKEEVEKEKVENKEEEEEEGVIYTIPLPTMNNMDGNKQCIIS